MRKTARRAASAAVKRAMRETAKALWTVLDFTATVWEGMSIRHNEPSSTSDQTEQMYPEP